MFNKRLAIITHKTLCNYVYLTYKYKQSVFSMVRILITGAFGNIGYHLIHRLMNKGYIIRCFDLKSPISEKKAKALNNTVEVFWGDICNLKSLEEILLNTDYVFHLAAIIPPLSEHNPQLAQKVNVEGTRALINRLSTFTKPPKFIFTSSVSVFGCTQDLPPPRKVTDPVHPTDNYSTTKVECEQIIHQAAIDFGLEYVILRLGAANPVVIGQFDPIMYEIPLHTRIEFVHPQDVALSLANCIDNPEVWGKTLLIGGGPSCQMYYRDLVSRVLDAYGVGNLPDHAFENTKPFYTDWLDTMESQRILRYQEHSFESYAQELSKLMGKARILVEIFRGWVSRWLLHKSPHFLQNLLKSRIPATKRIKTQKIASLPS
jgi:UDP-glucose 4-epimerase